MNVEEKCFINILRDYVNNSETHNIFGDFDKIVKLAKVHQCLGILYSQCNHLVSFDESIKHLFLYQTHMSFVREQVVANITEVLKNYNIVFFKGVVVSKLYKNPELRTMGDIDLLIHPEDRLLIHQKLLVSGFEFVDKANIVWIYRKAGILIEIHDALAHDRELTRIESKFFANAWDFVDEYGFQWNFHFLFLLFHIKHHIIGGGIGIRAFMDLALVISKVNLDWLWIENVCEALNLHEFLLKVLSLVSLWFDVESPFSLELTCTDFDILSQKVLNGGVFGKNDENNVAARVSNIYIDKDKNIIKTRLIYSISQFFPSYERMRRTGEYSYLEQHKFLLPLSWLHRSVTRLFSSKHKRRTFFNRVFCEKDVIIERVELLNKWGIR